MYLQDTTFFPTLGKERDLLNHLEQWSRALQGKGVSVLIVHQLFNADGPGYVSRVEHRDLVELENRRRQWQSEPTYQADLSQAIALSRSAPVSQLFEVLVPLPS